MKFLQSILIIPVLSFPAVSFPEEKPCGPDDTSAKHTQMSREEQMAMQREQMESMSPMFGKMVESMMQGRFTALAKPETTEQLALFTKRYYDALLDQGFEPEQALRIVIGVGIPSVQ